MTVCDGILCRTSHTLIQCDCDCDAKLIAITVALRERAFTDGSLYLSALGDGWAPAILNDQAELDFIRQGQSTFSDDRSCWLGGSTDTQPWDHINLNQYRIDDLGNQVFFLNILILFR